MAENEFATIYQFEPGGFRFEKTADGYNKVLPSIIGRYFEDARGVGTDLYVIKHYGKGKRSTILAKGYVPTGNVENALELKSKQDNLISMLDEEQITAASQIKQPSDIYQTREGQYSIVFVSCKDGCIGCGWYDHVGTKKKGLMLAASVLYAYGFINAEIDPIFWEATYKYLPFDSELGRSEDADKIIVDELRKTIVSRNNTPTKIIRLTSNDTNDDGEDN
ncbi:MAG: hypothetical protein MJ154_03790 [Candidatus Saccharibacteria bacterium]|nr:hypothetical protein [Candidatus Saccharibacteria bacterium]